MIGKERWQEFTFYQQMGNIASELSRAIRFELQKDIKHRNASSWRVIELVDLTIEDEKNFCRTKELCRFKEVLADWHCCTGVYDVSALALKNYALCFAMLERK